MASVKMAGAAIAALALGLGLRAAAAESVEEFYRGKTVTVLVGVGAGGEYDFQMRLIARHIGDYIPGHPATVAQNMVGATGLLMANHLYNLAPKDGTVIGLIQNGLPSFQAMGIDGVNFDARKFNWIGSIAPTVETMAVWKGSGVKTVADARRKDLTAGANGRSGITYTFPALMNDLLGTRFKIITGYSSVNQINIAMERGEVDGRNNSWTSWKSSKPDWLKHHDINILVYEGRSKPKDMDVDVPNFEDLTETAEDRQLLRLVTSGSRLGHPFATAPGVPPDRVAALRKAFQDMLRDPQFLREVAAARLEIDRVSGDQLQDTVDEIMTLPASVREKGKKLLQ